MRMLNWGSGEEGFIARSGLLELRGAIIDWKVLTFRHCYNAV